MQTVEFFVDQPQPIPSMHSKEVKSIPLTVQGYKMWGQKSMKLHKDCDLYKFKLLVMHSLFSNEIITVEDIDKRNAIPHVELYNRSINAVPDNISSYYTGGYTEYVTMKNINITQDYIEIKLKDNKHCTLFYKKNLLECEGRYSLYVIIEKVLNDFHKDKIAFIIKSIQDFIDDCVNVMHKNHKKHKQSKVKTKNPTSLSLQDENKKKEEILIDFNQYTQTFGSGYVQGLLGNCVKVMKNKGHKQPKVKTKNPTSLSLLHDENKKKEEIDTKDENKREEVSKECCVCFVGCKDIILLPCAHICVCFECAPKLVECPICRSHVTEYKKFYVV